MPRPFTCAQTVENRAFLEVLGQTGNARLAAREIGRAHSTMFHRRAAAAAFAREWEGALAAAHARLRRRRRGLADPSAPSPCPWQADGPGRARPARDGRDRLRTAGGEAVVARTRNGTLQLRPAHRGKLTGAAERAFLKALAATANMRFAAAAAGASASAFDRRRRERPAFARAVAARHAEAQVRVPRAAAAADARARHAALHPEVDRPPPDVTIAQALWVLRRYRHSGWKTPAERRLRRSGDG